MAGTAELVAVAERCCRGAAGLLRKRAAEGVAARRKGDGFDVVTAADVEAEEWLRAELRAAVPGSVVVGEEHGGRAGAGVTWYVDPVDGTGNYLRGVPLVCVSVGVAVRGRLVGGCVLDVFREECFTGGDGLPLRVWSPGGQVAPAAATAPLVLTDVPLPGRVTDEAMSFLGDLLRRAEVRRVYCTALSLAWVAAGRADAACNLGVHPWDVAAGAALVRAANGTFRNLDGTEPSTPAPGFVAAAPGAGELGAWLATRLAELTRT